MRLIFSFLLLTFSCLTVIVQEIPASGSRNKAVYAELLGNGMGVSINYDMRLSAGRQDGHGVRLGIGGSPVSGTDGLES
jgi:hypothetical protein